jgi:hypothetical protein
VDREERCDIDEHTRATIVQYSERLKDYDVAVKELDGGLVLDFDEPLDLASLREIVLLLWDNGVRKEQILLLRLDEPDQITQIIREGIDSLEHGTGKLTQAYRSYRRNWALFRRGTTPQRLSARNALGGDLKAMMEAMEDKENWDETDRRVSEILDRLDDQELQV